MSTRGDVSSVVRSNTDGRSRTALVFMPKDACGVVVLFHPFGFDAEAVMFGEQSGDRLISNLEGFIGPARALKLGVVAPTGAGRVLNGVSLGWPDHLDNAVDLALEIAQGLPVGTAGLSQGGLEALVAAGRRPDAVTCAYAVNPIVDVAAWYRDIRELPISVLAKMAVDELILQEFTVGPDEDPVQYHTRSALAYTDSLGLKPVTLVWSPQDEVVARQAQHHSGVLAERLLSSGNLTEIIQTTFGPKPDEAWRWSHESCDVWAMGGFFYTNFTTTSE